MEGDDIAGGMLDTMNDDELRAFASSFRDGELRRRGGHGCEPASQEEMRCPARPGTLGSAGRCMARRTSPERRSDVPPLSGASGG